MPTLTIELAATVVTIAGSRAIAAIVALAGGVLVLAVCRKAVWETTLTSAWWWSLAAVVSWGGIEIWSAVGLQSARTPSEQAIQLAAMALSLCPVVAVMGAKRPQDKAWNFVVLSFWAIMVMPAAETLLLHPGQRPGFGGARGWFLWLPILLVAASYFATRFWLAAILVAAGQLIAFGPYLALVQRAIVPEPQWIGFGLAVSGMVAAWLSRRGRPAKEVGINRQWIDFRDSFGVFWALRVQERMNAVAGQQGWGIDLQWDGFQGNRDDASAAPVDAATEPSVQATFNSLLRRFVSVSWLRSRAKGSSNNVGD